MLALTKQSVMSGLSSTVAWFLSSLSSLKESSPRSASGGGIPFSWTRDGSGRSAEANSDRDGIRAQPPVAGSTGIRDEQRAAPPSAPGPATSPAGRSAHPLPKMSTLGHLPHTQATPSPVAAHPCECEHERMMCVVCMVAVPALDFRPCGHVACCVDCGNQVLSCPICRGPINERLRVHLL